MLKKGKEESRSSEPARGIPATRIKYGTNLTRWSGWRTQGGKTLIKRHRVDRPKGTPPQISEQSSWLQLQFNTDIRSDTQHKSTTDYDPLLSTNSEYLANRLTVNYDI